MGKVRPQYLAFNAGEFDSDTLARADLEIYARGAETMENIMPLVQGGMKKVPGTRFIGDATALGSTILLRPFVFSETDTVVIQLSPGKMKFIVGEGYLQMGQAPATIGAWSDESAAPDTGGGTPINPGDYDIDDYFDFDPFRDGLYA